MLNKEIIDYSLVDIDPERTAIFEFQGINPGIEPSAMVSKLYYRAVEIFMQTAAPKGIIRGISSREFAVVYMGEGQNEKTTPLEHIFAQASHLALFAATMGAKISREITRLLDSGDFALGYMLDAVASFCTDKASRVGEKYFLETVKKNGRDDDTTSVLNYSPGYCGWHISGQKKLFAYLKPEEIGISLNESYLMIPLKSVSGVLTAGDRKIHFFKNNYPFCKECKTQSCRRRMKSLADS
jgi:hypothetical protein